MHGSAELVDRQAPTVVTNSERVTETRVSEVRVRPTAVQVVAGARPCSPVFNVSYTRSRWRARLCRQSSGVRGQDVANYRREFLFVVEVHDVALAPDFKVAVDVYKGESLIYVAQGVSNLVPRLGKEVVAPVGQVMVDADAGAFLSRGLVDALHLPAWCPFG